MKKVNPRKICITEKDKKRLEELIAEIEASGQSSREDLTALSQELSIAKIAILIIQRFFLMMVNILLNINADASIQQNSTSRRKAE